jgi:hypothetical protein
MVQLELEAARLLLDPLPQVMEVAEVELLLLLVHIAVEQAPPDLLQSIGKRKK